MANTKNEKNPQSTEEIKGMTLLLEMEYADGSIRGQGTGFFVVPDKIATNCHVLLEATKVIAKHIETDTTYTIEGIIAFDLKNDLVVLKTTDEGISFQLGDSDMVKSGETVCVLGYPEEEEQSRADGTLIDFLNHGRHIKFKAPAGPGYSGGPMLNSKGEVIAVIQGAKNKRGDGVAIPSNTLKALLAETGNVEVESLSTWQKRLDVHVITVYNLYEFGNWFKRTRFTLRFVWDVVKGMFYSIRASKKHTSGNYEAAIAIYDKSIASKLIPFMKRAYAARGMAKSELGSYQDAIEDVNEAILYDAEYYNGYFSRGHVNRVHGKSKANQGNTKEAQRLYQKAINDFTTAINLNSKEAKIYNSRGWTKYLLGKLEAEANLLGKLETEAENHVEADMRFHEAISDSEKALQLEIKNSKSRSTFYHTRGAARAGLGDHKEAIEDFNECIRLRPKIAVYYHDRGVSKQALGQHEAAEADFAKAKELDPHLKTSKKNA